MQYPQEGKAIKGLGGDQKEGGMCVEGELADWGFSSSLYSTYGAPLPPHPCVSRQPRVSSLSLSVGFRGLQGHDATILLIRPPLHQTHQHLNAASRGLARRQVGGGGERKWLCPGPRPPSLPPQRPQFGGGSKAEGQGCGRKGAVFPRRWRPELGGKSNIL